MPARPNPSACGPDPVGARRALVVSAALLAAGVARAQPPSPLQVTQERPAAARPPLPGASAVLPPEVATGLPQARLAGAGRLRWFGLTVYDARLWVGEDFRADDWTAAPFALELQYARRLKGAAIAERSLDEMRRVGTIGPDEAEQWLAALRRALPDVAAGDRLSGLHRPGQPVQFHRNGQPTFAVPGARFARLFFGIWLAPQTSAPDLRAALLRGVPGLPDAAGSQAS